MSDYFASDVEWAVDAALDEDLRLGPDVTTQTTVPADATGVALVVAREPGVISGVTPALLAAKKVSERLGTPIEVEKVLDDGARVKEGDVVLKVSGPIRAILTAERTMLNFLGQLSGVATATARWVDAVADTGAKIRDTRKTVPGLRLLQKKAVVDGGGVNHRMALGDVALIKDNHVAAAGGVKQAFDAVRAKAPDVPIEVEVDTLEQMREAIDAGADLILLDNFTPERMREAVEICRAANVKTEASGGLHFDVAKAVAASGVDYISIGALTHSSKVLDLGLDLQ
ncbi:nicotinate-nucleotide diphosphorylase (carboxylating) [Propionimicrobium lymphophilum ACS-093-V-SCH5]|uniref:Nicotinate-nucleotide pyrophosphorylase [carboxylating] n=1 Tax=Propionimicrobium lymphophilum ACS-093-V-SCH5 TaxID=883161 RepID=S2W6N9_9ACTN|nr:carboxylating nicotinate-nucleotide diphosphorylase [Propionimicrobium lymphophilum]EPD33910.1 nicotinate-nucleotide diphosphorylase (carboxylating) [Propionimicrobium lymphophilum ACS-093-V-SCH5]